MTSPDMDVIKEIPGYKVILKAILKSQIQQLVEQLAAHTEEESIILTASVSDGTLSHLGSDSGKSFLEDHEDVKSQFLGFCLKFHHKKKQEKERQLQEEQQQQQQQQQQMQIMAQRQFSPRGPSYQSRMQFSPRFPSPRQQMPLRSPGARHEPYPVSRPIRRPALNFGGRGRGGSPGAMRLPMGNKMDNSVIKIEPDDPDESSSHSAGDSAAQSRDPTAGPSSSQPSSPSHLTPAQVKSETAERDDDAKSNSSSSTIPNEASELKTSDSVVPQEGLSFDSDLSGLASSEPGSMKASGSGDDNEGGVNVKLESISESEMELEITGVEPGRSLAPSTSSQEAWAQGMPGYSPGGGAMGSQEDMQSPGYNVSSSSRDSSGGPDQLFNNDLPHRCQYCGRGFMYRCHLKIHLRIHTGVQPYQCPVCRRQFTQSSNLNVHMRRHSMTVVASGYAPRNKSAYCEQCRKNFPSAWHLERHQRIHTGYKPYQCDVCKRCFNQKCNLKGHMLSHLKSQVDELVARK